jgi:hypothetical protein
MVLARGAANIADQFFGWHPRGWASGFLVHLHSPWGYDEPEILRYSNRQFGLIGADAGQAERNRRAIWGAMNAPGEDAAFSRDSLPLASRGFRVVERF